MTPSIYRDKHKGDDNMITPVYTDEQRIMLENNNEKVLGTASQFVREHILLASIKEYINSGICKDETIINLLQTTNADYEISENKPPKYILFDLGGVLYRGNIKSFCMWCFQKYGVTPKFSDSKVTVDNRMDTGEFTIYDFIKDQSPELPEESKENIINKWAVIFKPVYSLLYLIGAINKEKCKVAALSNLDRYNGEYFKSLGHFKNFDRLFFSYEMGLVKPDNRIFTKIIKELKVDPREILFIDDQKENIDVAKRWNFNTLLFTKEMYHTSLFVDKLSSLGVEFNQILRIENQYE